MTSSAQGATAQASDARLPRRRLLRWLVGGVGGVLVAGAGGLELVARGVLPGRHELDLLDGACSVPAPQLHFRPVGPTHEGRFYSAARRKVVGYTIGFPPKFQRGDRVPLVVMLHGEGGDHRSALVGMTPAQAVALRVAREDLAPMALVTVDGGRGYWNPHPGDDPLAMVVDELIPRCQQLGLGTAPRGIGMMGISMGGYGAVEIAERNPGLVTAVAAISPAVWTSYAQAAAVNAGAFASATAFAAGDVVAHSSALRGIPVRIAAGVDDPFLAGQQALAAALPPGNTVVIVGGCHTAPFFLSQEPPSLAFLSEHLER
jgi:pimeloyl-ACP methyl ester carboxylesterase